MQKLAVCAALSVLAAAGLPSTPARAQALPGWKIADICARESAPGQCAAFEGRALKAVSASWPFVLESIRQACLAEFKAPADQSWRLLAECLDAQTLKALDKAAVLTAKTPAEPVPPPKPPEPPAAPPAAQPAAAAPAPAAEAPPAAPAQAPAAAPSEAPKQ